ncbi:MAG: LysM peptidoglycan-binding domain-containing protein [Acidimicrobiia bacterium]|nr:LysM peptidoglycan-binding domain-containing protein [Acidimicrobiia bacterium]
MTSAADGDHIGPARARPSEAGGRRSIAVRIAAFSVAPAIVLLAACGTTDEASKETLPPIRTTTSTEAPATSTIPEGTRFYVIKRGDTLAAIAASFSVTVQSIVDLNGLGNADAIQSGQTVEIPTGIIVIDELPEPPSTTTG